MTKNFIRAMAGGCAVFLAACTAGNVLDVKNLNSPDVARAYSTPAGVESIIGSLYQQFNNGWNTTNIETATEMISLEGYSTLANYCMNTRDFVPPIPIINDRGNGCDGQNLADFQNFQKLARNAANLVQAMDGITKAGGTTGSAAEDARDRGFAQFVTAISLGQTALIYDSAAIVNNTVPSTVIPPLSGYQAVMTAALAEIDSALATAGGANATAGFPLPVGWINGNAMSQAQWVQFVHSWKARLRADVARTPAERAAVNWANVIADAQAGITGDISITIGGGWSCSWICTGMYASGWHNMSMMILGMADTSGAYASFIAAPFSTRDGSQLLIRTPDLRMPQGATRALQNTDTPTSSAPFTPGRYFANRAASGDVAIGFGASEYDHRRWLTIYKTSLVGPMVQWPKSENDMLAAEGDIYAGNFAAAQALIDASRAKHGLPSIGPIASSTQLIAGGTGCVPQVPQAPAFNTVACGTILEAMKYEKRMETAFVSAHSWFIDGRGWGDLLYGMPTQWPVPNEEMSSRQENFYNLGGIGLPSSAGHGTYGF